MSYRRFRVVSPWPAVKGRAYDGGPDRILKTIELGNVKGL
jgi:hypothetical protein